MGKKPQESKAERMARVVNNAAANQGQKPEDQKPAQVAKAEDQKGVPAQAQGNGESKKKSVSNTVVAWKAGLKTPPPDTAKITLIVSPKSNPKKNKAAARYALYEDGMTVGQYVEKSHKAGNPKALARRDIVWDMCKEFIKVA